MNEFKLQFHHTGIAVSSIEEAKKSYTLLYPNAEFSAIYTIDSQAVNVCFLQVGPSAYLEFVEPINDTSGIHRLLKKGISYYHTAYLCDRLEEAVTSLETNHYKSLGYFHSEAFNGKRCIFLITPEGHLIELIEQ